MAPQDDLTAERAAELCFKLALLVDTGTHLEVDTEAMEAIAQALKTARQEALREYREAIAHKLQLDHCHRTNMVSNKQIIAALDQIDIALDRLASEGAPAPIDLLPKLNDDGSYGEHF